MGFAGKVMDGVNGIEWFYIVGILIFIGLFIAIVYRTVKLPKKDLNSYKNSILDPEDQTNNDSLLSSE